MGGKAVSGAQPRKCTPSQAAARSWRSARGAAASDSLAPGLRDPAPRTWTRRPPCSLRALCGDSASGGLRRLEPAATRRLHSSILGPGSTLQTAVHFLFENTGERKSERDPSVGRVEGGAQASRGGGPGGCGLHNRGPPRHGRHQAPSPRPATRHSGDPRAGSPGPGPPPAGGLAASLARSQPFRFQPLPRFPPPHMYLSQSTTRFLPAP